MREPDTVNVFSHLENRLKVVGCNCLSADSQPETNIPSKKILHKETLTATEVSLCYERTNDASDIAFRLGL